MNAEVISNIRLNDKFGYIELKSKEIASERNAGRFFMISSMPEGLFSSGPLLKRPFAICDITSSETFTFLYMVVGRGTQLLSRATKGDVFNIIGPLGNHFNLEKKANVALVAGGVGLAPMIITARRLKELNSKVTLFYGGKSAKDILMQDLLKSICDEIVITTEDGSLGNKGFVTEPLKQRIDDYKKVYACGPNPMLRAVSSLCGLAMAPIEVSLDEQMGCGVGACMGCLIAVHEQHNETIHKRCCIEGPIFNGVKVDWNKLIR